MRYFLVIALLMTGVATAAPHSFSASKKLMYKKLYPSGGDSFYCGCRFSYKSVKGKQKPVVDWTSCGFAPRKNAKRASRIEGEHAMPAHHFGQHLSCWRNGGRKACGKNKTFKVMEADLHNIVPAIGEVNGDRSNFKYGLIAGEKRPYGQCDAEVDFKARRFEPKPDIRGDIARIYYYMGNKYKVRLSKQQLRMFAAWDKEDPVDDRERWRNNQVKRLQGNGNPYIQ